MTTTTNIYSGEYISKHSIVVTKVTSRTVYYYFEVGAWRHYDTLHMNKKEFIQKYLTEGK